MIFFLQIYNLISSHGIVGLAHGNLVTFSRFLPPTFIMSNETKSTSLHSTNTIGVKRFKHTHTHTQSYIYIHALKLQNQDTP